MIWVTSSSGAEAPAVMPSVAMPSNCAHGISEACCNQQRLRAAGGRSATSTRAAASWKLFRSADDDSPVAASGDAFTASGVLVVA